MAKHRRPAYQPIKRLVLAHQVRPSTPTAIFSAQNVSHTARERQPLGKYSRRLRNWLPSSLTSKGRSIEYPYVTAANWAW